MSIQGPVGISSPDCPFSVHTFLDPVVPSVEKSQKPLQEHGFQTAWALTK